jgi:hypothetical protein
MCAVIWAKLKALDISAVPVWSFQVPLIPTPTQVEARQYGSHKLRIWRDEVAGIDMTSEIPRHVLSNLQALFLDDMRHISPSKYARFSASTPKLKLFRVDTNSQRHVYKCAPTEAQLGYQANTGFQDSVCVQNFSCWWCFNLCLVSYTFTKHSKSCRDGTMCAYRKGFHT